MRILGPGAAALACWAVLAGGCCAPMHCGDCGPHDIVAAAPCGPTACVPHENYSPQCVACGVNGPCPKHAGGKGLFSYLCGGALCGAGGCGEFYIHPWINDPPAPCDPCDQWGNWVGPRPCGPPACTVAGCPVGWHNLWGHQGGGAAANCCDGANGEFGYESMHHGEVIHGPTMAPPQEMEEIPPPEAPGATPEPREFPGPAEARTKTRSALKKVDGRPTAYYGRRPQGTILR
jgi:hypothetical protein